MLKGSASHKIVLFFFSFFALTLTACHDLDAPEPVALSYVSIYHGSPDAPDLDILFDNQIITTKGFKYATFSGYHRFYSGDRNFKFKQVNTATALIDSTFRLKADEAYSLFVVERLDNIELLMVQDSNQKPVTGKTALRIIHLSPDAPAVDVVTTGTNGTELTQNLGFKSHTAFKEIASGKQTVQVKAAGTDDVVLTVADYEFESGRVYTLLIRGFSTLPANSSNVLSAQLIKNY